MSELTYDPYAIAREAYLLWNPTKTGKDWINFRRSLKAKRSQPEFYYKRLAEICQDVLDKKIVEDAKIQPIAFAMGYFEGFAQFVEMKAATQEV